MRKFEDFSVLNNCCFLCVVSKILESEFGATLCTKYLGRVAANVDVTSQNNVLSIYGIL